jgi:hypothetical protein
MSKESSTWLGYSERVFPAMEWREYLRAFNIKWARTRSTELVPIWYAVEGNGYVVWVSEPRWTDDHWRIGLAVSASAPQAAWAIVEEIASSALTRFPGMRLETPSAREGRDAG